MEGQGQVRQLGDKVRESRLREMGGILGRRRDAGYIGRRMLEMELPGERKGGRPKRKVMDVVRTKGGGGGLFA